MSKDSTKQLAEYAVAAITDGVDVDVIVSRLAAYLIDAKRTRELPSLMRKIEAELEKRGTQQVVITSAHAVSEEIKMQLASLLGSKNPVFSTSIEPEMIGGVKARSGETEIDLTVRRKLMHFQQSIMSQESL